MPTANLPVEFEISGPGAIIGVGNGDPTSHEPDKGSKRSLFNGLAQVIVQSQRGGAGNLVLRQDGRSHICRNHHRRQHSRSADGGAGSGEIIPGPVLDVMSVSMSLTRRSILKASLAALPAYYASRVFGQTIPATPDALDPNKIPPILDALFKASDVRLLPGSPFLIARNFIARKSWRRMNRTSCFSPIGRLPDCRRRKASRRAMQVGTRDSSGGI